MKKTEKNVVSIIVPVYNAEDYIVDTIESVRRQTWEDWELLLVLDGCTDGTERAVSAYCAQAGDSRIRLLRQSNQGAAAARNYGLAQARGRFIAYLDADDLWKPDKLEKQVAFVLEKEAAFSFTGYEFADAQGNGTGKVVRIPASLAYRDALKNTTIFTSTVMFDTERIPRELLCMPQVKSEDTALWWKVLRQGYTARGLDENLTLYRRAGSSLSSNKVEAVRRIWNLYRSQEGLGVVRSAYYFCFWAVRAVLRRV